MSHTAELIAGGTELLLGNMPGSLGEVAALALLAGFAYLLWRRVIRWHVPVTVLATMAVFAFVYALGKGMTGAALWQLPLFHVLAGGLHGDGLFDLADDRPRRGDLRCGNRRHHDADPSLGSLSRGHVVRHPDHERLRSSYQQICQTQALRREISRCEV